MYNVEDYIEECLKSLWKQTLKDIEVIVVDDCSTDNSAAVVKKFLPRFKERLTLIQLKRNIGYPGLPRNLAMQQAQGKYIYFLDSDDFISETALEDFYKVAEKFKADVVHSEKCFVYEEVDGEYTSEVGSFQLGEFVEEPTLETEDIGKRVNDFVQKKYIWWGCNKLFRRKFLEENKIQFPKMKTFEDLVFSFCCVIAAKNYVRVPFVNYYYRIRKSSLSHKGNTFDEIVYCLTEAVKTIENFMCERKIFSDNPDYRYSAIDFFSQEIFTVCSKNNILLNSEYTLGEIYDFLVKDIFAKNSGDNGALLAYLFMAANIYKILSEQQESRIVQLQNQLLKLQAKGE